MKRLVAIGIKRKGKPWEYKTKESHEKNNHAVNDSPMPVLQRVQDGKKHLRT